MSGSTDGKSTELPILDEVGVELYRLFRDQHERGGPFRAVSARLRVHSRLALLLVGTLIAASAATAAVTLTNQPTRPIAGTHGIACQPGYEYLVSAKTGLVYPPSYPLVRQLGSKTSCFSTEQAALNAGFKLAPPPKGDVQVGNFYFGPPTTVVLNACREARRTAGAAVYCPAQLPQEWADGTPTMNNDCPGAGCSNFLAIAGSVVGYGFEVGGIESRADATVWAISTTQQRNNPGRVGCKGKRVGRTTFRGHPAGWYRCPDHDNGTVISALKWDIGQEHYGVSADGPHGRTLAQYIAEHLVRQAPTR
jgi:hypothetical protein